MKTEKKDKVVFSGLIEKNQKIIHKITAVYAETAEDREDLFQEICLQLWRSFRSFRGDSGFSTWMYRVALNTAISMVRKKNKITFEELKKERQIPEQPHEYDVSIQLLYAAISRLNYIDRAIVLLWLEEKDYQEIASITGITKTNVSVKLVRIKRKLQEIINEKTAKS